MPPRRCEAGLIQTVVAKVRAEREANIARRKDTLVGTSDFPDLAEEHGRRAGAAAPRRHAVESTDRRRSPASGSPSPSSACATGATPISPSTGARPEGVSRLSRPRRRFQRARELRQEPVRGRRHRSGGRKRRQPRETIQGIRAPSSPASALPTRSMRARPTTRPRRWPKPAPSTSISPASPATTSRRWKVPALAPSFTRAVIRLAILNAAYDEI